MTTPHLKNPTVKTLLGVWALFLSFAFIQVGNGIQRVLLPVRGETEGFSPSVMGLVMAFHFSGYLFGAKFAPKSLAFKTFVDCLIISSFPIKPKTGTPNLAPTAAVAIKCAPAPVSQ